MQCLYTITGVETLHPDFEQLRRDGIKPELEIMGRLIAFFGPVSNGLVTHINEERWGQVMMAISERTMDGDSTGPGRFETWEEKDYPNLPRDKKVPVENDQSRSVKEVNDGRNFGRPLVESVTGFERLNAS
jgi:hypothetical protein